MWRVLSSHLHPLVLRRTTTAQAFRLVARSDQDALLLCWLLQAPVGREGQAALLQARQQQGKAPARIGAAHAGAIHELPGLLGPLQHSAPCQHPAWCHTLMPQHDSWSLQEQ